MRHFKAPQAPDNSLDHSNENRLGIFLGGSIEMGAAERWQDRLVDRLSTLPCAARLDIFNPRRDDWDASWPNNYDFAPFREQVGWEMERQMEADLLVYYFAADTLSPITLLEMGLFHDRNPVIGTDARYKRLGNLMVTKDYFAMDIHAGWDSFVSAIEKRLILLS
jgi:hypothetical protein